MDALFLIVLVVWVNGEQSPPIQMRSPEHCETERFKLIGRPGVKAECVGRGSVA